MKQKIYNLIASFGIWFMGKMFPEYFAVEPLRITDIYAEYSWALYHVHLYTQKAKVLDIGSAGSMFPLLIRALEHDIYITDIRNVYYEGITCLKHSICKTPFKKNVFDIITAISTIEHIGLKGRYGVEKEDTPLLAIKEIYRILRPNGIFLMTVPFEENYKETKHHRIYNHDVLKELLKDFVVEIEIVKSPEANYQLALIKAVKP